VDGKTAAPKPVHTEFSPYAGRTFPSRVFWGDTHLHTAISVDAGTMCRLGQEDAFRFARGEEVTTTHGLRAKLSRPLDFIVVSDHAEMYGLMPQLLKGDPDILATEKGRRWHDMLKTGDRDQIFAAAMEIVASLQKKDPPFESTKTVRSAWQAYTALADRYNEPGRFTALIGYEWTAIGGSRRPPARRSSPSPTTGTSATAACSPWRPSPGSLSTGRPPSCERAWSPSSRPPRSRATARRILFSRRTTSSPTTRLGTAPTWTAPS
jgi:hypothetical protein